MEGDVARILELMNSPEVKPADPRIAFAPRSRPKARLRHLAFLRVEYVSHHFGNGPSDLDDGPGHVSDGSDDFDSRLSGAPQELADAESNVNDFNVFPQLTQQAGLGACTTCRLFPDVRFGLRALEGTVICRTQGAEAGTRKQEDLLVSMCGSRTEA